MVFNKESEFENALVDLLKEKGWKDGVLKNPSEANLIRNWAEILFQNNRHIDRLNDYPLTDGEMQQIIEQIETLKTPLRLNGFINGGSVSVKRDNPDDVAHFGKEVSLKIYDRREIAAGQSRYQIAQQPKFPTKSKIMNDRRGDLMLLINGMPVIHIELKKSGIPVSQASNQIEKYAGEGIFSGLFALVQIFVAMNPEEALYFANPGPEGKFNSDFYFHWADFNNEPINDWKDIASTLLSIPMAHQLIGFYTVADDSDGVLKVMRSYQYYAANAISDKVSKTKWEGNNQLGGYIWHTTGSGKTMTSFKSAQLIATSKDADKVVFLMDRIELGTQSLKEYRNFAGAGLTEQQKANTVQETEDTHVLISKLKSSDPADTLIVTSIQKMSNISEENDGLKAADLAVMNNKRVVFIIDEAHRSTFGDMLLTIKETFPKAIFFGFTGTPIQEENQKKMSTTSTIFGNELHRYSIADGIRDKNVLGFDPYKVLTFKDKDVRQVVALERAKANTVSEAMSDPAKKSVFLEYMQKVPMAGYEQADGTYIKGIEDFLPKIQYRTDEHQEMVVEDILANWEILSQGSKFHAIFATSSIPEAIEYYHRFKAASSDLKFTALFDPSIDNNGGAKFKEDGLVELIEDYNERYGQDFTAASFAKMKKDIAARLAHKKPYERIDREPEKQIDLLIVVDQMLTGFDSKWINTLYLDKVLQYENIIQAFSRTNRLFGPDKPFGTIKYYRKPHTMEKNIEAAVKLYSGDKPFGLFVQRLPDNLLGMNFVFREIKTVFSQAGIPDFERLPPSTAECKKFAVLFRKFNSYLEAAKVQGFRWKKLEYTFENEDSNTEFTITLDLDETAFLVLVKRYKELFGQGAGQGGGDVPYDIEGYITTIDTDKIDTDYMNSRFDKYLKLLHTGGAGSEELKQAEDELHRTFATLSQEEQKFANIFLHDIQSGDVEVDPSKSFRDYVTDYVSQAKNDQIHRVALVLGLDEAALRKMMAQRITEDNINEFGRFDALKATVDKAAAKAYFEALTGQKLIPPKVNIRVDSFLREFIVKGGFDIEDQSDTTVQTVHQAQYYDDSAYSTMKQAAEPSADIS
ncbi:MAG: HsdR family type I site-specific deoxyribonuclease [Oscillospiraceae bacterium]|nr:HsdR family type I site-specific deoxyribonuclease [Oscillospiraceae bacterium]MBQ9686015.1 HsdR family type I site-specific deoxyribonuclease [Oscillospiraceae bacterium]